MSPPDLSALQATIANCDKQVGIDTLSPGFPVLNIRNAQSSASISLYGAQVLGFQPQDQPELLWLSPAARFAQGRSIRGGIPLCWPWFGPHPDNTDMPAHGFARHRHWRLDRVSGDDHCTRLDFSLPSTEDTATLWACPTELTLTVIVGPALELALTTTNSGSAPVQISAALHSYFAVSDIGAIRIEGLDDTLFRDAVNGDRICRQCGPIRFHGELDRVYHDTGADVVIHDPTRDHGIRIGKGGSRSTVVWNPWVEKAARLGDIPTGAYRQMVCVETANADHNRVALLPGESHCLSTTISCEGASS